MLISLLNFCFQPSQFECSPQNDRFLNAEILKLPCSMQEIFKCVSDVAHLICISQTESSTNDTALSFPRYQCISILWDVHLFCLIYSDTNTINKWIFHAIQIHTLIKFDNLLTRPQSSVYTTTLPEILWFNQQLFVRLLFTKTTVVEKSDFF